MQKLVATLLCPSIYFIIPLLLLFCSCTHKATPDKSLYRFKSDEGIPDYSNLNYWAAHPWKWDPSDSIPKPLRTGNTRDSAADVFFIHPTTLTDFDDNRLNADIDDSIINIKTDYSAILYQASAFNEQCRLFAPRYRQAHLKAFYSDDSSLRSAAFEKAYSDVKKAFQYYLENYNNGRPVILASHSQGTLHAAKLLQEFFEEKNLQNRLVCAYLIGMPLPENYFNSLIPCKDSTSTGCIVSWRTLKRNYVDTLFVSKEKFKSWVTNPLTWTITEDYAPASLNTGGVLTNFNRITHNVVDAQIHGNVLWTCKPRFFGNIFLRTKNYHIGDINLFYTNIRNNVKTRISYFLRK